MASDLISDICQRPRKLAPVNHCPINRKSLQILSNQVLLRYKLFMLFISLFASGVSAQQNLLLHYATKGQEHHSGTADLEVTKCEVSVNKNQLHFEVEVKDDQLQLNSGRINSDHVEFWFTINTENKQLYSLENRGYINNSEDEVDDEAWMYFGTPYSFEPRDPNEDFEEQFKQSFAGKTHYLNIPEEVIDNAEVKMHRDFSGLVHWGVFSDTSILFDSHLYKQSELPRQLPPLTSNFTETSEGWKLSINFRIEHLVFLRKIKTSDLRLNVVVFDQDEDGLAIHSLTEAYAWGDVTGFPSVKLDQPLTIPLDAAYQDYEQSPFFNETNSYVFYDGQWKPHIEAYDTDYWWDDLYDIDWMPITLSRQKVRIGPHAAFIYDRGGDVQLLHFPKQNRWIETELIYEELKDSFDIITFNDGGVGFFNRTSYMQSPWGTGPCGACMHFVTELIRITENGVEAILSMDYNSGNMVCRWSFEMEIEEYWIPDFEFASEDYEEEVSPIDTEFIEWDAERNQLLIPCSNEHYEQDSEEKTIVRIGWDEEWNPILVDP